MLQQSEADSNEGQHEVQAEEVAVGQLGAAACEAEADHVQLGADQRADVQLEVEEVVEDDRESDDKRLADLSGSQRSAMRVRSGEWVKEPSLTSTPLTPARMLMLLVQKVESIDM